MCVGTYVCILNERLFYFAFRTAVLWTVSTWIWVRLGKKGIPAKTSSSRYLTTVYRPIIPIWHTITWANTNNNNRIYIVTYTRVRIFSFFLLFRVFSSPPLPVPRATLNTPRFLHPLMTVCISFPVRISRRRRRRREIVLVSDLHQANKLLFFHLPSRATPTTRPPLTACHTPKTSTVSYMYMNTHCKLGFQRFRTHSTIS